MNQEVTTITEPNLRPTVTAAYFAEYYSNYYATSYAGVPSRVFAEEFFNASGLLVNLTVDGESMRRAGRAAAYESKEWSKEWN